MPWQIWIDTGGTFTDCLALDPEGRLHRAKVLSNSALRGTVVARPAPAAVRVELGQRLPPGFLRGFSLRLLGSDETWSVVEHRGGALALDAPVGADALGRSCELLSPEEAPVLAVRLVTGTPLGGELPEIALRLGTTKGTNALLERKGAKVALFITRGFGDLLVIGTQQRPDLFALDVRKPAPLYSEVVEVEERLAADGSVLVPLDEPPVARAAQRLRAAGFDSAAVALLHSYLNPLHERRVGEILRAAGLRFVSLSAGLAPLIKLLPRAETAVVDAYLAPILESYLQRVSAPLARGTLHVMTSAGGLVAAASFRAKDGLLSGPAGGVVGAALAGKRSGLTRVIGFDMGGTSTDVARFDGDYDYVFEHRVGDAHLVAPALAVETVAAGGGSICRFDGHQLAVGPESAGAWPGPACYGAGGPLTLTDVNLLLGRLDPSRFQIPMAVDAAEAALASLVRQMATLAPPRAELLAGLLAIADERMAEAIRWISVRRGYDPADYALVAFGGAGPQHACAVADLLGMTSIVVPVDAGLLSALGLGHAVVERFAQRQVLAPLAEVIGKLDRWADELGEEARTAVIAEGIAPSAVVVRRRLANLRFAGQEAVVTVELTRAAELEASLRAAYRALYGYHPEDRAIEVESLRAVASSAELPRPTLTPGPSPWQGEGETHLLTPSSPSMGEEGRGGEGRGGGAESAQGRPVWDRGQLAAGARLVGPCLVFEPHSATWVAPGWEGWVDEAANLVLKSTRR